MALRIVQIGVGGWGQDWFKNIVSKSLDFELAGCVDVDPTMLKKVQALGVMPEQCFTSIEQALETVDFDAVLITSTLPFHVPLALTALNAGKHVLVEKPFAPTVAEAQKVVELGDSKMRVVMVSQNYRFFPAVRTVMALLREGTLGPIHTINIDFRRYANLAPVTGHRHYALPQPLLMDMSIHHFDLMRAITGKEPEIVNCTTWNPAWSNFVDAPAGAAIITFDGGIVVSYRGSWISSGPPTPWAGEWHIECEGGEIAWTSRADAGLNAERVEVRQLGKSYQAVEMPDLTHIDRAGTLHAFAEAIRLGHEPETSARSNLGSLALMFAAIESAASGNPVHLG